MDFGTLADDLGSFPFDYGFITRSLTPVITVSGIRSLIGFGNLVGPLAHSVLYPHYLLHEAIPKYISGRTSYLRV